MIEPMLREVQDPSPICQQYPSALGSGSRDQDTIPGTAVAQGALLPYGRHASSLTPTLSSRPLWHETKSRKKEGSDFSGSR